MKKISLVLILVTSLVLAGCSITSPSSKNAMMDDNDEMMSSGDMMQKDDNMMMSGESMMKDDDGMSMSGDMMMQEDQKKMTR